MPIIRRRGWEIPEHQVTPEAIAMNRRSLMKGVGAAGLLLAGGRAAMANDPAPTDNLHPYPRNAAYAVERELTPERITSRYNNFYEFGTTKSIWQEAQALKTRPWSIKVDGLVEQPFEIGIDDLITAMPREERVYRFRCVEAWGMTVPWSGFAMKAFLDRAKPLGSAKYLRIETFVDPRIAPGQRQIWYPWPYVEGLTIAEAANELAFLVTGIYGKPLPKQYGAPIRLALPWKYGFKSIKSIKRITFTEERPKSFWEVLQSAEYGFWANVNPEVAHPRWSQATEEVLGENRRIPTQLFNGYGDYVADLYKGLEKERLWA
ncbi:MAG: protein-methionine-sulfoxide reductase catalytic subunit MsrP [Methylobacterium sp.]|nr:protein-methionine-sulfoxide reductase catalytic subunit MsrP [Methylobacterium sp.]MCA3655111.1 protein-methionine-sulfoxide reductase catalytic subunit MsrP [Methylobacterium sp.]MCA3657682.1 protein-methionine-sulfoxide reductase catalytic subunit MsrP [Methylobacterium sp.]MCA3662751.1 protein-methionine-sulfoxide reductase catalytic subunit MsrP [Methylobacterium sp.]MCA3670389.1 protein-methionine-sulfoxide reductase catalytic subunit MsrP [Methylobacterium sp.]